MVYLESMQGFELDELVTSDMQEFSILAVLAS